MQGIPDKIKLYRCLRSDRVFNGIVHNECNDIIARNPGIIFIPGLTGVEVYHKVYQETSWDSNLNDYPLSYLEIYEGRCGHILVSAIFTPREHPKDRRANPMFYQPEWTRDANRPNWYIAGNTAIIQVCIEKIIEIVPLTK